MALTVAVTGPTGEIGISAVSALEKEPSVDRILAMARRPFDPGTHGWIKTEYRQGDILDQEAVRGLVTDADVVIHLAFLILGSREESRQVNLTGTRNVFEAVVHTQRPTRLVYTFSVAAYGYHPDLPGSGRTLVHHDDVATAVAATAVGRGQPGAYNLAADGVVTFSDVAAAVGAVAVPVPKAAASVASDVLARLPWVPSMAEWIHVARTPVLMDTDKAKDQLGWQPQYTGQETLADMAKGLSEPCRSFLS